MFTARKLIPDSLLPAKGHISTFFRARNLRSEFSSELVETKMGLLAAENTTAALEDQLATRESELLSLKQELEEAQPRHFSSTEELEVWLANDDTNQMEYSSDEFNCVDFALMLQERALDSGYILSTEVLPVGSHWVNIAIIGDRIYIIEPQDDRVILEKKINRGESG